MAHMTIKSGNPDISWVLCKNPETGMIVRKIRKGFGYGWFTQNNDTTPNGQEYNLMFREDHDSDSFSENGFSYLGQAEFTSAFAYNCLITTLLRDAVKGATEKDVVALQEITLKQVGFKGYKLLEQLQTFLGCELEITELRPMIFELKFSAESTLHDLVANVMIACLYLGGDHGARLTKLDESFMNKYANLINKLELPYFLRYVFARNFFRDSATFNKMAPKLETDTIKLAHGDTAMQRFRYIEKQLDMTRPILDVGCGEGLYALNISKRNPFTYHAVDIDEDLADMVFRKGRSRGLDIQTYTNLDQFQETGAVDIIFTEVVEHMPLEDAKALFHKLLKMNFNKLIITTPDRDFNKNYLLGDEFRHDDHDWEMNSEEFFDWVKVQLNELHEQGVEVTEEWIGIGDCVDGVYTSQGFIIQNTKVQKEAVITVGVPASGKSTYAQKLVNTGLWTEVNRDDIRFRGGVKDWTKYSFNPRTEGAVQKKWVKKIDKAIENGENIVVSDTNLDPVRTKHLQDKLEAAGYNVTIKTFDVPFEELLKRDTQREGGVGYEVLLNMYIRFQRDWNGIKLYQPNETDQRCYVVDLDGTVAHNGKRSIYDESKVDTDTPIHHVMLVVKSLLEAGIKVVFLSGRQGTEECLRKTREWLVTYLGDQALDCLLIMREEGDTRPDYVVKLELFDRYIRNNYYVLAAIDDRKQVIEQCWNVLGVNVMSVGNPTERF